MVKSGKNKAAVSPAGVRSCVVLITQDANETEMVGEFISKVNMCVHVTYRRLEDFMLSPPVHPVTMVIIATTSPPELTRRVLAWIRNRWRRCSVTVIGETGSGLYELQARMGGANFLTRPVADGEWAALFSFLTSEDYAMREPRGI